MQLENFINPTMEKDESEQLARYSTRRTVNGLITYLLDGKRIPKRDVPKPFLSQIPMPEIDKDTKRSPFYLPGYSYLQGFGRTRLYYYEGVRIQKSRIPKKELENIIDAHAYWSNKWEQTRRDAQDKFEKEYRKEEKTPNKEEPHRAKGPAYLKMSPPELLQAEKIHSRSDWKIWMLRNHPDKNPDSDTQLVAMVNAAVHLVYPN